MVMYMYMYLVLLSINKQKIELNKFLLHHSINSTITTLDMYVYNCFITV